MKLRDSFDGLKNQYQLQPFPELGIRLDLLKGLRRLLKENQKEIVQAISDDFSYRSAYESEFAEIFPALKSIRHTEKNLSDWMQAKKRKVGIWFQPAKAQVMYQPLGVIGIIVPWNYPLYLALGPLVGALAAGNRVMIKMSEFTPKFSQLFATLCKKYIGNDWVRVINGGVDVAEQFSHLPFDHLLFTGSVNVGKKVMKAASENLTPVTLELGGKSPTIIDKDYPLNTAMERLLFGKLLNAGQTCLAPDYVFVHESKLDKLATLAQSVAQRFYPQWREQGYTALSSEKQVENYQSLLADALAKGAKLVPLFQGCDKGSYIVEQKAVPLLVLNTSEDMRIRQEEIFAPLLPVVGYNHHQEVKDWINSQPRPLALYLFSKNQSLIRDYMTQTISGGVTLNDTILHVSQDELPFGGVGASGMGHYHGEEGFKTFSKAKSIYKQSRFSGIKLMYPPQSKLSKFLLRLMKK